jgi:hypothetical protein
LNDSDLVRRFGDAGRKVVHSKFSRDPQLQNTIELYERLLSSNK